jgi:hypothetical protein
MTPQRRALAEIVVRGPIPVIHEVVPMDHPVAVATR